MPDQLPRPENAVPEEALGLRAALHIATVRAEIQALRASAQGGEVHELRRQMALMQQSTIWRLTLPLRLAIDIVRGLPDGASAEALLLRRFLTVARRDGVAEAVAQLRAWRRRRRAQTLAITAAAGAADNQPAPAATLLEPFVLIVAELSIPQCAKYRVWQKQEHFTLLGLRSRVIDWHDTAACHAAAATATLAIFYRVPGHPAVLGLIATLKTLGVPTAWEVDDLIFDRAAYLQNQNLKTLDPGLMESVLSGVSLYAGAMRACDFAIASTPHLAAAMRDAGMARVEVVENALDSETLAAAARIRAGRAPQDGVIIVYGSGTKTHDADFRVAAPALLRLLEQNPALSLRIIGELNLPAEFQRFVGRVECLPPAPYARYLEYLGGADISIAPLEPTAFNDAKSNIKFLEAAILGLPSVCSPAANFTAVIEEGATGFIAATDDAWFAALASLAADSGLRARIGQAALETMLARYAPERIARDQAARLVPPSRPSRPKLRILLANVYFAPRSYGGATLVAEQMAARLRAMPDTDVHVVTSLGADGGIYALRRQHRAGMQLFEIPTVGGDVVADFDDPLTGAAFGDVLDAMRPHVVHLHSIQMLSASLATACRARGIPYVITLHDAWWLCARQFMVKADGNYCHQTKIDLRACQSCLPEARHLPPRALLLREALDNAALLLSPSAAHRALYLANGIPPEKIAVAPNGVVLAAPGFQRRPGETLRFAYVGGLEKVKGFAHVQHAFEAQRDGNWQLTVVDNTLNLGFSSMDVSAWQVSGRLQVIPAYQQEGLDDFFAGIDVLLFPSQWKESFGLTVREALARDVWVIATEGGGPGEAIVEGINGNLIPLDGRHEPLAAAIAALLENPARLRNHRNPLAGDILDFDAQARALHKTLSTIADIGGAAA